jgi:RNA-binding protein YlmH
VPSSVTSQLPSPRTKASSARPYVFITAESAEDAVVALVMVRHAPFVQMSFRQVVINTVWLVLKTRTASLSFDSLLASFHRHERRKFQHFVQVCQADCTMRYR